MSTVTETSNDPHENLGAEQKMEVTLPETRLIAAPTFAELCSGFQKYLVHDDKFEAIKRASQEDREKEFSAFLIRDRNLFACESRKLCLSMNRSLRKFGRRPVTRRLRAHETLIKKYLISAITEESKKIRTLTESQKEQLHDYFKKLE